MNTYFFDYEPGDRVKNPKAPEWGIGQVQSIIKNRVTVNFEDAGKKTVDGSVIDLERVTWNLQQSNFKIKTDYYV